ncbi:MAG: histidine phosphatase family protein [Clostridia bacterium]|nr:histidine phosphatase family protein [Clostridia bacterium]
MKIIFLNHGEENILKGTLTLKGKLQAFFARQYLKGEKIDEIFISPQTCALQTANIVNKNRKISLNIFKEFDERGVLKLNQIATLQDEFTKNYFNYNFESEEYETCKTYLDRVFSGLNRIVDKQLDCVLIVGHSSALYAINTFINKIPKNGHINLIKCKDGTVVKFYI